MERDLLLVALVAEILGPRGGPDELLGQQEDPREEYITGVLAPHRSTSVEPDADTELVGEDRVSDDDQGDGGVEILAPTTLDHLIYPALDPRARAASLGLSFAVACTGGSPVADLCFTWGRYAPEIGGGWRRRPLGELWDEVALDGPATRVSGQDPGIRLQVSSRHREKHWRVTVFLVNITPSSDEMPSTEEHVFQPQIRVRCRPGTTLVPLDEGELCDDGRRQEAGHALPVPSFFRPWPPLLRHVGGSGPRETPPHAPSAHHTAVLLGRWSGRLRPGSSSPVLARLMFAPNTPPFFR